VSKESKISIERHLGRHIIFSRLTGGVQLRQIIDELKVWKMQKRPEEVSRRLATELFPVHYAVAIALERAFISIQGKFPEIVGLVLLGSWGKGGGLFRETFSQWFSTDVDIAPLISHPPTGLEHKSLTEQSFLRELKEAFLQQLKTVHRPLFEEFSYNSDLFCSGDLGTFRYIEVRSDVQQHAVDILEAYCNGRGSVTISEIFMQLQPIIPVALHAQRQSHILDVLRDLKTNSPSVWSQIKDDLEFEFTLVCEVKREYFSPPYPSSVSKDSERLFTMWSGKVFLPLNRRVRAAQVKLFRQLLDSI
jgi:hypothetical protein